MEPYRDGSPTPRKHMSHTLLTSFAALFRSRSFRVFGLAVICFSLLGAVTLYSPVQAQVPDWLTLSQPQSSAQVPYYGTGDSSRVTADTTQNLKCATFPDPGNIAIALKTGATEAVERIPTVMLTTLQCAKNMMIFSDLEQDIAGHHLYDSLKDIPQKFIDENPDFFFYKKLQEYEKYGQIPTMLKDFHNPDNSWDLAAWTLDKYKQLHALDHLYARYPDKDWYFMFDADTYVIWQNLVTWLPQLPDPRKNKLYFGSLAMVGDTPFAHGGSGIMISQASMHALFVENNHTAAKWDEPMKRECCGDYVIALAMKEIGIDVKSVWPTISGDKPLTGTFGPKYWCQPVVTLHHMTPYEMNEVANFESARLVANATIPNPLIWADLYNNLTADAIPDTMDDWDSGADDGDSEAGTFEECQKTCEKDRECFQFTHHDKTCKISKSFHLGTSHPKEKEEDAPMKSGWLKDRINSWIAKHSACKIKFPQPE